MNQYRVLVADGDQDALTKIAFQMKRDGFDIHGASDGGLALTLARKFRPDLIFIDIGIRYVNFARLISELRSDFELRNIKIVLMSNDLNLREQPWISEVEVDDWVEKPMTATEFGVVTRKVLEPNALPRGA